MKYFSVLAIAGFLLLGCQTAGTDKLFAKNVKPVNETSKEEEVEGLKIAKPIVCISNVKLLAHLKSVGEVPYAIWFDENFGHPVVMLSNVETGSLTVLEYPYQGKATTPMYEGLACVLSSGVGLNIKPSKSKKIEIFLKR